MTKVIEVENCWECPHLMDMEDGYWRCNELHWVVSPDKNVFDPKCPLKEKGEGGE